MKPSKAIPLLLSMIVTAIALIVVPYFYLFRRYDSQFTFRFLALILALIVVFSGWGLSIHLETSIGKSIVLVFFSYFSHACILTGLFWIFQPRFLRDEIPFFFKGWWLFLILVLILILKMGIEWLWFFWLAHKKKNAIWLSLSGVVYSQLIFFVFSTIWIFVAIMNAVGK